MGNSVTHRVNSESSMLEQLGQLSNSSFGVSKFSFNSVGSPKSPFSFPNFISSPTKTSSPNPISPAGLSLILVQETNPFEEVKNIVFSTPLKIDVQIFQTREIDSIPKNQVDEPMELIPPPMMLGPLTVEDIILSEEYTCVRIFGPNPKVTHIFGDYVLKSHPFNIQTAPTGAVQAAADSHDPSYSNLYFTEGFLKNCFVCKKIHEKWSEIYFYRDMSFCSEECRLEEMLADYHEEMVPSAKKPWGSSPSGSSIRTVSSTSQEVIFFVSNMPKSQSW